MKQKIIFFVQTVTKPTHLELDNGQVQSHSTNGKIKLHLHVVIFNTRIIYRKQLLSDLIACIYNQKIYLRFEIFPNSKSHIRSWHTVLRIRNYSFVICMKLFSFQDNKYLLTLFRFQINLK